MTIGLEPAWHPVEAASVNECLNEHRGADREWVRLLDRLVDMRGLPTGWL